jgi:hypothetical protein
MTAIRYVSPLQLPPNWVKTPPGRRSYDNNFSRALTIKEALDFLEDEANLLAPDSSATVFSSYDNLRHERGRKALNSDTSVCIKLGNDRFPAMIACDKWSLLEHNIYALSLALRSIRNFETWGVCSSEQILSIFCVAGQKTHAPSSAPVLPDWMTDLGLGPTATLEDANAIYRRRAKLISGDEQALMELNLAMDAARKHLR